MLGTMSIHGISRITGPFGTKRGFWQCWRHCSVVTLSLLSLAFLWLYYFAQTVLAALQGCHFMITSPGLSVAQQLLVTLSPSLRPVLPAVLEVDSQTILEVEVDTCDESRGDSRGRHPCPVSRLDSTRTWSVVRDCKLCAPGADMFSAADIWFFAFMLLSIPSIRSDLCMGCLRG